MKNLFTLMVVLFMSSITYGQCLSVINGSKNGSGSYKYHDNPYGHWYIAGMVDLNNAFDIDETVHEPQGIDYDVEVGVRNRNFAYYIFYGGYKAERGGFKVDFNNYGAGVDYFLLERGRAKLAVGANAGLWIKNSTALSGTMEDISYFTYAIRVKPVYKINKSIGLFLIGQYQHRPDRTFSGIFEVLGGLQFYIN